MARLFVTSINLNKNELQNARIHNLSSAPSTPAAGQVYYDTSTNILYFYNGTAWISTSGSAEVIQDTVDTMLIAGTGLDKTYDDNAGTLTIDIDSTVTTNSGTQTLTNKTIDAASNTLTGVATLTGTQTLTNKTLTAPRFADGGHIADANGNEEIKFVATPSAVNEITVTNAAASGKPTISATGGDTNITLNLVSKGTGTVQANGVDLATTSGTQTLTNKTITSPTVSGLYLSDSSIVFEGSTADGSETTLQATNPTDDRTITLPDASGTVILTTNKVTDLTAPTGSFSMNSQKITNLATPTDSTDAANKAYVDGLTSGLDWKASVNLLAASNVALTGSTNTLVIDGHAALDSTDNNVYRILLKGQTTGSQNGIYTYTDNGTNYTLVRSADADAFGELIGAAIFIMEGTTYASTSWVQSNHYITDFSNQTWVQFSGSGTYLATGGLTLTGNTFSVDTTPSSGSASIRTDNGATEVKTDTSRGLSVDANGLGINAGTGLAFSSNALTFASGYGVRKFSENIASTTAHTTTHNFGTRDVTVAVYDNNSPYAEVFPDVEHATTNTVIIRFASAPTADQYRVVIIG